AVIAQLPPAGLELYRRRAEPQAKKWLADARPQRDARLLRKIVDEAFCTRAGEEALNLLGDLAFEQGRFEEAACWWRLLLPVKPDERAGPGIVLAYPDAVQTPARVEAKLLLARIFRGPDERLAAAVKAYQSRYGTAEGWLAGRRGCLADILATVAAERREQE